MKNLTALTLTILVLSFNSAFAGDPAEPGIGIVTGPGTGTNIKIGQDIAAVAVQEDIRVEVKESRGSVDNIRRLDSTENAVMGIVQSDVLGYISRIKEGKIANSLKDLRMVFPLYQEEVHLLANKSINSFADLKGKKIIVGPEGSGTWLTAMNLLAMEGIMPRQIIRSEPAEGLAMVVTGKADATFFVGGKPTKLFKNMEELGGLSKEKNLLDNVHFVELGSQKMLQEYNSSSLTPADYNFIKQPVKTISVTALLMSYNFSDRPSEYAKQRCDDVAKITSVIYNNIEELKTVGHPKWKEVNLDSDVKIWQRDPCARTDRTPVALNPQSDLEKELLSTIRKRW